MIIPLSPERHPMTLGLEHGAQIFGNLASMAGHVALAEQAGVGAQLMVGDGCMNYGQYNNASIWSNDTRNLAGFSLTYDRGQLMGEHALSREDRRTLTEQEVNSPRDTFHLAHTAAAKIEPLPECLPQFEASGNGHSDSVVVNAKRLVPVLARALYVVGGALAAGAGSRDKKHLTTDLDIEFRSPSGLSNGWYSSKQGHVELSAVNANTRQGAQLRMEYKHLVQLPDEELCTVQAVLRTEDRSNRGPILITEDSLCQRRGELAIKRRQGYGGKGDPGTTEHIAKPTVIMDMVHTVLETVGQDT